MISKTEIKKRLENKRNPHVVKAVILALKNNQLELAKKLTYPNSKYKNVNLSELNSIKESKVIVVGKILSQGEITKKMSVAALGFSENAKEKLINAKCDVKTIIEELESNKELKGVKIL